jgi:hypothetical protein
MLLIKNSRYYYKFVHSFPVPHAVQKLEYINHQSTTVYPLLNSYIIILSDYDYYMNVSIKCTENSRNCNYKGEYYICYEYMNILQRKIYTTVQETWIYKSSEYYTHF